MAKKAVAAIPPKPTPVATAKPLRKPQIERGTGMVPVTQIGERLMQILEVRRITAAQACLKAGLSRDTARNLLRGRAKEPRPSMLGLLADALQVDIRVLKCELPIPPGLQPFPPKPPRSKTRKVDTSISPEDGREQLPEVGFQDPDLRLHLQPAQGTWSIPPDALAGRGLDTKHLIVVRSPNAIPEIGVRKRDRLLVDTNATFVYRGWVVGTRDGIPWAGKRELNLTRRGYSELDEEGQQAGFPEEPTKPAATPPKIVVYGQIVAVLCWLDD